MKTIKNIFKSKITYAVLACLLLVGIFAGITTLADKGQPTLTITGKNINHDNGASIVYKVTVENINAAESLNNFTMKFWAEAPKSAADTANNVTSPYSYTKNDDGSYDLYFESVVFAPKDMTTAVYAAACYTDKDGNSTYSDFVRYSVFEYLCEANLNTNKTAEQANLYAAMKDYITYAQKYLGYTDATTPDKIGYITVLNGYFTIDGDPSGTKFTHASIPQGVTYTIHYNFAGLTYRVESGYTYTSINEPVNWGTNGVQAPDLDRTFTVSKIVSFNVPAIENTQILELRPNTNKPHNGRLNADGTYPALFVGGELALETLNSTPNTSAGTYVVTERYDSFKKGAASGDYHIWGIAANPYDENGVPFSHWELADGTFYSDDISLVFNEFAEVKSKDPTTPTEVNLDIKPVYLAADNSLTEFAITGGNDANKLVDPTTNGFTYDASAKTASGNTYVQAKGSVATGKKIDRVMLSYNVLVNKHENHDATSGNDRRLLYGLNTNTAFNELTLGYNGTSQLAFEFLLGFSDDLENCALTMRGGANNKTTLVFNMSAASFFAFGEEAEITIVSEYNDEGSTYSVKRTHVYLNGVYIGFGTIHKPANNVFAHGGNVSINYLSNNNNKTLINYSGIKYYEFFVK